MPEALPYDVFLSHNAKDKPQARQLAERLRAAARLLKTTRWRVTSVDQSMIKPRANHGKTEPIAPAGQIPYTSLTLSAPVLRLLVPTICGRIATPLCLPFGAADSRS